MLVPLPFVITSFLNKLHTLCNSYVDSMKLKSSVSQADKTSFKYLRFVVSLRTKFESSLTVCYCASKIEAAGSSRTFVPT